MTKTLYYAAFLCGLLVLGWMAASYGPASPLALALLAAIAGFYLLGAAELLRYRQASAGLQRQLQQPPAEPAALESWLAPLPAALQSAVRLRLLGQRVALPGPLLAPYVAGLLVLLGMLGTFLGLVLTLRGTGIALEQAGDVEAIRASLAAPVRGLGLAFGTSVAGVGASAALGLMTVLARGERQACASLLDKLQAGALRLVQPAAQALQAQRLHEEQVLQQLQLQTQHLAQLAEIGRFGAQLPALVAQLQQLGERTAQQTEALHLELRSGQAQARQALAEELQRQLGQLADRVGAALEHGLAEGARLAGATLEPAVQGALAGLAQEHRSLQATVIEEHRSLQAAIGQEHRSLQTALGQAHTLVQQEMQAQWQQASRALQAQSAQALQQQIEASGQALQQQAASLVQQLGQAQAEQARQAAEHSRAQLQGLQASLAQAMASQSEGLLAEVRRLVQAAADAPRAAALVIGELRSALSDSLVRDNAALAEREQLLGTLAELLQALRTAGGEQRAAVDALVQAAARAIDEASQRLEHSAQASVQAQQQALAQAGSAAAGLAGLAEGFAAGVQAFASASGESSAQLARIESALAHTLARSDEQLAYYVAQAREIVDLTLGTQRQVVDELQQIVPAVRASQSRAAADAEASLP